MVWLRRWKAQLTWHKVSEFANLLFWAGLMSLIFGVVGVPVIGWVGLALLVWALATLAWSDTFLPDYNKEDKEGKGKDSVW